MMRAVPSHRKIHSNLESPKSRSQRSNLISEGVQIELPYPVFAQVQLLSLADSEPSRLHDSRSRGNRREERRTPGRYL